MKRNHQRNRRRLMQWERFHQRHPRSGAEQIGPVRYHTAHLRVYDLAATQGRWAPNGIRMPWHLGIGEDEL